MLHDKYENFSFLFNYLYIYIYIKYDKLYKKKNLHYRSKGFLCVLYTREKLNV